MAFWLGVQDCRADRADEALRTLARAVEAGYLIGEAWDLDPFLDSLRDLPEFEKIRAEARRKQEEFLAFRRARLGGD